MVPYPTGSGLPNQNSLPASPTPDGSLLPIATIDPSYEPAYWDLPAQVGGYEIMVVVSSENQACSPPNQLQLLLHAIPGQPQTLTTADIQQLEKLTNRSISLMFTSGVVSIQQVQNQMESWKAEMAGGCITTGGPIIIPTPTLGNSQSQNNTPAPQFLYRSRNHLVLVNGYTGESTELPIEVTDQDKFVWSPDGKYIQASLYVEKKGLCLNLYDPDKQAWVYSQPIACGVQEALFSRDSSRIFYSTYEQSHDQTNSKMWVYNLQDETRREVYGMSSSKQALFGYTFINLKWSPTSTYLTFESSQFALSGNNVSLVIVNVETGKSVTLNAPSIYDATYNPIWSSDDHWFVLILKDQYASLGAETPPDDRGDLYLVNSETGKEYRLTYTPTAAEIDVHWTDDGKIAYTEVTEQKLTLTLEEAMTVKVVPSDQIITPEPVEVVYHSLWEGYIISLNKNIAAWLSQKSQADKDYRLTIGNIVSSPPTEIFSVPISEPDQPNNILIGWRPSNYPYLGG